MNIETCNLDKAVHMKKIKLSALLMLTCISVAHLSASKIDEEKLSRAYVEANTDLDFEAVRVLFENARIKEKQNHFEEVLPSSELSYIHEPYWRYNILQLREYGERIVTKISPYFVDEGCVDGKSKTVFHQGEAVKVRKVTEFGRVLPLIYVQEMLIRKKSKDLAVPRIFIVPTKSKPISFTFHMPYLREDCHSIVLDSGNNSLQVESDSFDLYQEYIEGEGFAGDKSFSQLGHFDFNAKQIVKSTVDGKKYLIDTKESKNFFMPQLNPIAGSFFAYWHLKIGRHLPQDENAFERWKKKQQRLMLQEKALHYPVELPSIQVDIEPLDLMRSGVLNLSETLFFNDDEDSLYFAEPKDNIARYLALGRFELLKKLVTENPDISLDGISVPTLVDATTLRQLSPVQFILNQNLPIKDAFELLDIFKNQREYFENPEDNKESSFWPLQMALQKMNPELIEFMILAGANPNEKIYSETILDRAIRLLSREMSSKKLENQQPLMTILETLIERFDEIAPTTLIEMMRILPSGGGDYSESLLTIEVWKSLFEKMLKKSKEESHKVILEAANQGNLKVLNLVLGHYVDQAVLQEGLKGLLKAEPKSKFKELTEDLRLTLLRAVLEKVDYVDAASLEAAFTLGLKEIISDMTDKEFDVEFTLRAAVQNVKDPSHDYLRTIMPDSVPRDPYWNELVKKILTRAPSAEALDGSIAHALANGKAQILETLLPFMPKNAPRSEREVSGIVSCPYTSDSMLEKAISTGNVPLTRLLVSANIKVGIKHFREALWIRKDRRSPIFDILIEAKTISLGAALNDSIYAGNAEAIRKLVPKFEKIPSDAYKRAFATKNMDVIEAIMSTLNPESDNKVLMKLYDVEDLTKSGDVSVIDVMVERNVNVGEALIAITRLITFAADWKLEVDYGWYGLLGRIAAKNPPAQDVDHSLAIALTNSKILILGKLISQMPEDAPKSKSAVQQLVGNKYMRDDHFRDAIFLNNKILIRLFRECGIGIKPSHLQLAERYNLQESLSAMKD